SEVPGDHQAEGVNDNNPIDQPVSTLQQLLSSLSSTSPHKIHEACLAGDLDRIKQLVKAGASINAPVTVASIVRAGVRTIVKNHGGDPLGLSRDGYHCYQMTPNRKTRKWIRKWLQSKGMEIPDLKQLKQSQQQKESEKNRREELGLASDDSTEEALEGYIAGVPKDDEL
ncbi:hypothetical protein Pmar_PMAR012134, partial [Perkinsus marinus ATCC 50983]